MSSHANLDEIRQRLRSFGQEHLLAFYDELDEPARRELLGQIAELDLERLSELIETHVRSAPEVPLPQRPEPPPICPAEPADQGLRGQYEEAHRLGEQQIREGKVAAFVVAGGQGTRLGFAGPKGCLGVTPIRRKSLFQVFAEQILATGRRYQARVPWYVMTSPSNDRQTREFFAERRFFDLPPEDVIFFTQGTMPAIGLDGKLLLSSKHSLALSPDGHGGSLTALRRSGALDDMVRRGVEHISYFQVDNPLVRCVDPLFIGLHAQRRAQMSAKALPKRDPMEKLGNFIQSDGKVMVIEYSDLPEDLAHACGSDGRLVFWAGSIAIHVLDRAFVEQLTAGGRCRLPFHRAVKKVPHVDASGRLVEPEQPNAVKLEMFVFDALPLADNTLILETQRMEEFSPVKNATGQDSLATSLHDQVRRAASWLEQARVSVPRDADGQIACAIEISPLLALTARDVREKVSPDMPIAPGQDVYLG